METLFEQGRRRYDPLNDYLFYKIMGEKGNEIQLLGFINAVLGKTGDDRFTAVEILENKTFSPQAIGDKSSTLDVRAVLSTTAMVNVEVQLRNQHNIDKRSLYYWSKIYSGSLAAGQDYHELPQVISIIIVNYDFPPTQGYHSCFHLREDTEHDKVLTDALEIHYINMVKYRKLGKSTLSDPLNRWVTWLNKSSPAELVTEVIKMDAAIQAANDRMVYVTGDREAIWAYERRLIALSDHTSEMNYAHDKGRNEEREIIARNLKKSGFPAEQISQATGLPLETIQQL